MYWTLKDFKSVPAAEPEAAPTSFHEYSSCHIAHALPRSFVQVPSGSRLQKHLSLPEQRRSPGLPLQIFKSSIAPSAHLPHPGRGGRADPRMPNTLPFSGRPVLLPPPGPDERVALLPSSRVPNHPSALSFSIPRGSFRGQFLHSE